MNTDNIFFLITIGALVGAASGYLGGFMVLKRMSLVGDALSHVALPGIAVALSFGINPMLGALTALAVAIIGIWYLEKKTEVYPDALVGVFFTGALSLGLLLTPEPELLEALFGDIDKITSLDGLMVIAGVAVIFVATKLISKKLLLSVVSEDLAKSQGIKTDRVNLVYLLLVGLVVALGVKFLGTLLTGAMVIIPAVAAKNVSKSIKEFQAIAIALGAVSTTIGILIAKYFATPSGPIVVLVAIACFGFSFIFRRK